jgi:3-oxoacyl-[acyl-carrier protein] reductase
MTDRAVALVTGSSRGIGRAIARRLAADGFHVIVNSRASQEQAAAVVAEIGEAGGSAEAIPADVTDLEQARRMVAEIRNRHRHLDVLVNNAGRREDGFLLMTPADRWWRLFEDNVAAVVNCSRAALPLILAAPSPAIVNISSLSGVRGTEGQTAYSAAKAAVIGFTKALARELAHKRVSVNCVAPGPIQTEMYAMGPESTRLRRLADLPLGRVGCPDEVAEVVSLLVGGKATFVHGQVIAVDGGGSI